MFNLHERIYHHIKPNPMIGLTVDLDWKDLAETKRRISEVISGKIINIVREKIDKFVEESMVERTSTDLFGYNRKKPDINKLEKEIEDFLKELVNLEVITNFRFSIFKEGIPEARIAIFVNDGSKYFQGSIHFRDMFKLW